MKIMVTGGAGFIGSAMIRFLIASTPHEVLNLDKLTYAGNLDSLAGIGASSRYRFVQADICEAGSVTPLLEQFAPDAVLHLAAESHVDRSIDGPAPFVHTNIVGTQVLLECVRRYWDPLPADRKQAFRFLHVSTDEVFGSLGATGLFSETTPYNPSSPYSASKAASDHLVNAWHRTYGLPVLVTNCSNNYGPYQFPEKLIPLMILKALRGESLPVYGDGLQVRDWLYVDDHVRALYRVLAAGRIGETYNVGGHNEQTNLGVVQTLCEVLDRIATPRPPGIDRYEDLVSFVADRPGHDRRYAIDASKVGRELGWQPLETFPTGLEKTVRWYLDNPHWWSRVLDGSYRGDRLGLSARAHAGTVS